MVTIEQSSVDEGAEQLEPSCIAGRTVKWCSHVGKLFDIFLKR
jgi:hypothetical protein